MEKIDKKERLAVFLLGILTLLGLTLFWGKQGHIIIDAGREYLISEQVMNGGVLYKEIFNIYGALAYQLNAILFKLFGNHVMTLYIAGNITAIGIVAASYTLSRQFLNWQYSFFITLFILGACVYRGTIFNYVMPYSYAVLYGMLAVTISLIFLVKYLKNSDNGIRDFYLSLLFGGVAFAFKYDFAPYALIFPYAALFVKKLSIRELFISAVCAVLVPLISFSILLMQGVNFSDILYTLNLFKEIAKAPGLIYFYENIGVYPNFDLAFQNAVHFLSGLIIIFLLYKVFKKFWPSKSASFNSAFLVILFVLSVFSSYKFNIAYRITFLPILLTILFALKIKKVFEDKTLFVFIISALLISLKTFLYFALNLYGLYYLPFLLIAVITLLKNYYIKNEAMFKRITCFVLAVFALSAAISNFERDTILKYKIETKKGAIAAASGRSSSKLLIDKLSETNENDKIVVLPEGHFINYLSDRAGDSFYNNFIPMYVEAFGEQNIINHYDKNKPDYFVLNDRDTSMYGKSYICTNYAQNLCEWIFKNYHVVYKIVGEPNYTVLRKNE